MHMQGILWKRRDIFRNRWRPRWFVLHSDQRLLTYYLLANQESERVVSGCSTSTPSRRRSATAFTTPLSSSMSVGSAINSTSLNNNENQDTNRRRTFSESSNVSAHTIDCDVVPRGTIYLFGSTVEANDALTIPEEDLYALTITDHENATHCHLAARTIEARDQWIHRIRRVCQNENGAPSPERHEASTNRVPYSPQTPMPNRRVATKMGRNGIAAKENYGNISHPSGSHRNNSHRNDTSYNTFGKDLPDSCREIEVLILFVPLVLYKVLTMVSLFGLGALCFVATSSLALRWILIQHFLRVVRPLTSLDESKYSLSTMPIGHGSICCRLSEYLRDICGTGNESSLSHILVWSLAKGIRQQPHLVSKRYKLLPHFYSTDVVFLNLNDKTLEQSDGIWVSKAGEMNLNEITDCFNKIKQQHPPVGLLQQTIGPACRIIMTSDDRDGDSRQVQLELNLADCPITVFVSCATHTEQRKDQVTSISINFQSTDVNACRKFAEEFQKSIRSAKV